MKQHFLSSNQPSSFKVLQTQVKPFLQIFKMLNFDQLDLFMDFRLGLICILDVDQSPFYFCYGYECQVLHVRSYWTLGLCSFGPSRPQYDQILFWACLHICYWVLFHLGLIFIGLSLLLFALGSFLVLLWVFILHQLIERRPLED